MNRRSITSKLLVSAVGFWGLISVPNISAAQTATSTSGGGAQLDEIIVTATKRSVNLQNVPIAITAVTGNEIKADHIVDVRDLADSQPGLAYTNSNAFDEQLAIRGIVTVHLGDPTAEPSVATFIDGVYIGGQGVVLNNYYDIDRIEITRGPQGVLLGKNVAAGALSVWNAKPEFDPSGSIDVSYGNFASSLVTGHFTDAITDTLAGRIAFQFRDSTGYFKNLLLDRNMDGYTSGQVRAELLWRPSDDLQALFSLDYGQQWTSGDGRSATPDPFFPGVGGQVSYQLQQGSSTLQSFSNVPDYSRQQSTAATLTVDYNAFSGAKLTSVTNLRIGTGTNLFQQLQAPSPPLLLTSAVYQNFKPTEYSEDFRVTSNDSSSPFDYIAGVYWYGNKVNAFTSDDAISPLANCAAFGGIICGISYYTEDERTNTYAVYGQLGYSITSELHATIGARYTRDEKSGTRGGLCVSNQYGFPTCATPLSIPPGASYDVPFGETWNKFTPQAVLNYQITPLSMVYASWNKGFKGGGWDQLPANGTIARVAFNPESATNYEIGTKNEFLDHRLRLNVALYYLAYKDLQVQEINDICLCLVTNNAGSALSKGVEVESEYVVNEAFRFNVGAALIKAHYEDFVDAGVDESGHELQLAPKNKASAGVALTPELGPLGRSLELRAEYTIQSAYFLAPANTNAQGGFHLVNAFLTYAPEGSQWSVGIWGRNLTDKIYPMYANAFVGDVQTSWAPPRTYGVSAHYAFKGAAHHH
jgi:iron complex outermembrane recepter protein